MEILKKYSAFITKVNEYLTKYFTIWLIYPLILTITFEVISRYFFNKPTVWAFDISWMLYGALVFLGAGYVLAVNGHVRADIFYNMMPKKVQHIVMICCYIVFFFPAMGGLVYASFSQALRAFLVNETSASTIMHLPLWPIRTVMLIAVTLLVLQGLGNVCQEIVGLVEERKNKKNGGEIDYVS